MRCSRFRFSVRVIYGMAVTLALLHFRAPPKKEGMTAGYWTTGESTIPKKMATYTFTHDS